LLLAASCSTTAKEQGQVIVGGRALLRDPVCDQIKDAEWQNRRALWLPQAEPYAAAAVTSR